MPCVMASRNSATESKSLSQLLIASYLILPLSSFGARAYVILGVTTGNNTGSFPGNSNFRNKVGFLRQTTIMSPVIRNKKLIDWFS